jgi:hypothetical protein
MLFTFRLGGGGGGRGPEGKISVQFCSYHKTVKMLWFMNRRLNENSPPFFFSKILFYLAMHFYCHVRRRVPTAHLYLSEIK